MKHAKRQQGQVMLLTVLVLSSVFLSATAVAGILVINQLGQVAKVIDSARAVFAADTGIERGLFAVFRCNPTSPAFPAGWGAADIQRVCDSARAQEPTLNVTPPFMNDASYRMVIVPNQTSGPNTATFVRATGRAGRSARAFEVSF